MNELQYYLGLFGSFLEETPQEGIWERVDRSALRGRFTEILPTVHGFGARPELLVVTSIRNEELEFKNFCGHSTRVPVKLTESPLYIQGRNRGGKTLILNAISYALHGIHGVTIPFATMDELVAGDVDEMVVKLTFSWKGRVFCLSRGRSFVTKKGERRATPAEILSIDVKENGRFVDLKKAVESSLPREIREIRSDTQNVHDFILGSFGTYRILNAMSAARSLTRTGRADVTDLFTRLFGLGIFYDAGYAEVTKRLEWTREEIKVLYGKIQENLVDPEDIKAVGEELADLQAKARDLTADLEAKKQALEDAKRALTARQEVAGERSALSDEIASMERENKQTRKNIPEFSRELQEKTSQGRKISEEIKAISARIQEAKEEISKARASLAEKTRLHQELHADDDLAKEIAGLEGQLREKEGLVAPLQNAEDVLTNCAECPHFAGVKEHFFSSALKAREDAQRLKAEIKGARARLTLSEERRTELKSLLGDFDPITAEREHSVILKKPDQLLTSQKEMERSLRAVEEHIQTLKARLESEKGLLSEEQKVLESKSKKLAEPPDVDTSAEEKAAREASFQVESVQKDLDSKQQEIGSVEQKQRSLTEKSRRAVGLKGEKTKKEKDENIYACLQLIFGKTGIRTIEIRNKIGPVLRTANRLLDTDKILKGSSIKVSLDQDLLIRARNGQLGHTLSGEESIQVAVALAGAILERQGSFLLIDDIGVIDDLHLEILLHILSSLKREVQVIVTGCHDLDFENKVLTEKALKKTSG